ncbi:MAG: hypothetical protein RSE41_03165 [Clostridia bacterium]
MSKKFHFSYDAINLDATTAREFLLSVIDSSPIIGIYSPVSSTIILEYPDTVFFQYIVPFLKLNLTDESVKNKKYHYYFALTKIEKDKNGNHLEFYIPDPSIDINLQKDWKNRSNYKEKYAKFITKYESIEKK